MPSQPIYTPEALDALIAASRQSRHQRLVKSVRNQRIRTRVGYGCSGCIVLLALAAIFLAHDPEAAAVLAMMACVTFSFAYFVGRSVERKLADALRKTQPTG